MTKLKKAAILAAARHLSFEEMHGAPAFPSLPRQRLCAWAAPRTGGPCPSTPVAGLKELFKGFDKDGDGAITLDELREGLARQGSFSDNEVSQVRAASACRRWRQCGVGFGGAGRLTKAILAQIFKDTDVNKDGTIGYEEFLAGEPGLAPRRAAGGVRCMCAAPAPGTPPPSRWPAPTPAATVNVQLLDREEIFIKAFQEFDKVTRRPPCPPARPPGRLPGLCTCLPACPPGMLPSDRNPARLGAR